MPYLVYKRLVLILSGLWLGVILAVGYLVAPTLFASIPDRQLAGLVAGEVFKITTILTVILQVSLMFLVNGLVKRGVSEYRPVRWYVLIILLLAMVGGYVIAPWMNELRLLAQESGHAIMDSVYGPTFARLHGVSSSLFLSEAVLGLLLFWKLTGLAALANQSNE